VNDVCEVLAVGAGLIARLAAQGPWCGTVRVLRSVLLAPEQVRERRERRVLRVLAQSLLGGCDLPGDRVDFSAQLQVLAGQPVNLVREPTVFGTESIILGGDLAFVVFRTGCHAKTTSNHQDVSRIAK